MHSILFVLDFSAGWFVLLAFSIALFAIFTYLRKSIKNVIYFGIIGLAVSLATETIGVGMNLWNYTGGNWPVLLWPTYMIITMAFYQIFSVIKK